MVNFVRLCRETLLGVIFSFVFFIGLGIAIIMSIIGKWNGWNWMYHGDFDSSN
jgi:hypothetical protein